MTGLLHVQDLRVSFGERQILNGIELLATPGKVTALIGGSGSGKTTLLRSILGLVPEARGRVEYPSSAALEMRDVGHDEEREANLRAIRQDIGYVPQSSTLLPFLPVRNNVALPLRAVAGLERSEAEARANQYLEALGIAHLAEVRPWRISGGERQRAALARALVVEPELLLLDEPTSALDVGTIKLSGEVIRREVHNRNCAAVIASHNLGFVQNYCDEIVVLRGGAISKPVAPANIDWNKLVTELL